MIKRFFLILSKVSEEEKEMGMVYTPFSKHDVIKKYARKMGIYTK